jgi:hypothetical protein
MSDAFEEWEKWKLGPGKIWESGPNLYPDPDQYVLWSRAELVFPGEPWVGVDYGYDPALLVWVNNEQPG